MARVQVNRIWQQHFGTGIVATSENLGMSGAAPTHPELLEWLAAEFVRSGWSVKHVQRLILNSAAFRQTSVAVAPQPAEPAPLAVDPDNRLLWRFPLRRLDAEALRDAMLAVSGELDTSSGGPYVPTQRLETGEVIVADSQPGALRRSIYLQQRRTQVLSMLQVFDAPSIVFNSMRRPRTTMPLQSLGLLNSAFVRARAAALAERLEREAGDEEARVGCLYELTHARAPASDERQAAFEFLDLQTREYEGQADARRRAWVDLSQNILMSNEFLYVE
jgi:hypothetical protein